MKKIIFSGCLLFLQGYSMATPFSFDFPERVTNLTLKSPSVMRASDDIKLAYYDFVPENPKNIIIFYHGGGLWSNALYQYMAEHIKQQSNIGVYLFDIRGHGNSQGPRGDAPSIGQIWQDISSAVDFISQKYPSCSIVLGGHSSGAGLVLNYSSWPKRKEVAGYVLLSPFLGARSNTTYNHTNIEKRFAKKVRLFPLIVSALTNGFFFAHTPVIFFNYPESEKQKDTHILDYYTSVMAIATSPNDAHALFKQLDKSCLVLIGENDEQFIPSKIIDFQKYVVLVNSVFQIMPNVTHLSAIIESPVMIAQWIESLKF